MQGDCTKQIGFCRNTGTCATINRFNFDFKHLALTSPLLQFPALIHERTQAVSLGIFPLLSSMDVRGYRRGKEEKCVEEKQSTLRVHSIDLKMFDFLRNRSEIRVVFSCQSACNFSGVQRRLLSLSINHCGRLAACRIYISLLSPW